MAAAAGMCLVLLMTMGALAGCRGSDAASASGAVHGTGLSQNRKVGGYHKSGLDKVDWAVAREAFKTARSMGIKPGDKIMVALFAAALVVSD
jgi:hypothetical protein